MSYPITNVRFDQRAQLVNGTILTISQHAPGWKQRAESGFLLSWLVHDLLPRINAEGGWLSILEDASGYPQAARDKFEAFATQGWTTPPSDYWAEYDAVRAALISVGARARTIALANLSDAFSINASGLVVWKSIGPDTTLASNVQDVIDSIG